MALESNKVSGLNQPLVELALQDDSGLWSSLEMDRKGLDDLIVKLKEALEGVNSI